MVTVRKSDYSNLRIDPLVTAQAMQFFQTDNRFLGVRDVPLMRVDTPSGILSVLDTDDLNRDEVRKRTSDAEAEKAGFKFKDVTFKTDERSLEYDVNAARMAGASPGRDPSKVIPFALAYKASIHTEVRFKDLWASASWFRTVTGAAADGADTGVAMPRKFWSDSTTDPVSALRKEVDIFLKRTGMLPTALRLGRELYTTLATHEKVRAQVSVMVSGTSSSTSAKLMPPATEEQLSALFGMRVTTGSAIRNLAAEGLAANNDFILPPKSALMTFDAPSQIITPDTPTGFARLAFTGLSPDGFQVRVFDRPEIGAGGSKAHVLDIYNGFLVVDNKMGTFFDTMMQ